MHRRSALLVTVSDVAPAVTSRQSSRRVGTGEAVGGRVSSAQFVGRTEQLAVLGAAFEQVSNGRTTTVLIGGDAGVGKTRLVEEFSSIARGQGALVATGVCVPTDSGGLPYAPIVGIVRDVLSQLASPNADVAGPVVRGLGIDTSGEVLPVDEFAKTRLFESILTFVLKVANETPVVFVIEDLHWADSASAELLGYLVRNLTDAKALIAVTYRAEEVLRDHPLHGWLTELDSASAHDPTASRRARPRRDRDADRRDPRPAAELGTRRRRVGPFARQPVLRRRAHRRSRRSVVVAGVARRDPQSRRGVVEADAATTSGHCRSGDDGH